MGQWIAGGLLGLAMLFGGTPVFSGTASNPGVSAIFETSLAAPMAVSDTAMTLASNSIIGTVTLPSGYTCFTLDSGTNVTEYVCGTVSGTSVTGMLRGVSPVTGTTTVAALAFSHRRGADVKITDWPTLGILNNQLNGRETIPNLLTYDNKVLIVGGSASSTIATKYYVDNVVASGAPDASETVKGVVELATGIESASSTSLGGTGARLVPPSSACTSIGGTAGYWCVITNAMGKIQQSFFDFTQQFTFTGGIISTASSTFTTTLNANNLNVSGTSALATTTINGVNVAPKFGGSGSDGALNITSGTTTVDLAGAAVVEKNYTSINISSGASLSFSNPASAGTVVVLRSQGAITIAGNITLNTGAGGGAAVAGNTNGNPGGQSYDIEDTGTHNGAGGTTNSTGTGGAAGAAGAALTAVNIANPYSTSTSYFYRRNIMIVSGSGGASGAGASSGTGGAAGGRGGGGLLIEAGSTWNFTGIINDNGTSGSTSAPSSVNGDGGGGGGGGGQVVVLYNTLTASSGSVTNAGGNGGNGSATTAGGSARGGGGGGGGGAGVTFAGGAAGAGANSGNTGANGAAGSGPTGGSGGTGSAGTSNSGGGGGGGGGGSGASVIAKNLWFF